MFTIYKGDDMVDVWNGFKANKKWSEYFKVDHHGFECTSGEVLKQKWLNECKKNNLEILEFNQVNFTQLYPNYKEYEG